MGSYKLRALRLSDWGRHQMLTVTSSCMTGAEPGMRQRAIEHIAALHGMSLSTTKSLRYDPTFTSRDGINSDGKIRIGPSAFSQDHSWLAAVLFHEVVHSDQFEFYRRRGISFGKPKYEAERILVALDECEGFYWPLYNAKKLGLSEKQTAAFRREVRLWLVEIDDKETAALARSGAFQQARRMLIKRLAAEKNKSLPKAA